MRDLDYDMVRYFDELQACIVLRGGSVGTLENLKKLPLEEFLRIVLGNDIYICIDKGKAEILLPEVKARRLDKYGY